MVFLCIILNNGITRCDSVCNNTCYNRTRRSEMSDLFPRSSLYPLKSEIHLDIRTQILPHRKRSVCVVKICRLIVVILRTTTFLL
jgi:hypothetical protein